MTTCGIPPSMEPRCPAKLAYQVCECTRSAPSQSEAIARSTPSVWSAALADGELGQVGVRRGVGLVARRAEAAHLYLHVTALAQCPDELGDVDACSPVDRWRVLLAEDVDAHVRDPSP